MKKQTLQELLNKVGGVGVRTAEVLLLLFLGGFLFEFTASLIDRYNPPPGQFVDIGGYRLHLYCKGQGSPTVVLESGMGRSCLDWYPIQNRIARITRVCSYDRAGLGWSDPGPKPRTSQQMVKELGHLLKKAQVPGPFLLVGHSLGGLNMLLFTRQHPKEVVGAILLDPSYLGLNLPYPSQRERKILEGRKRCRLFEFRVNKALGLQRIRSLLLKEPAFISKLPPPVQKPYQALWIKGTHQATLLEEEASFTESLAQLRDPPPLKEKPLIILTQGEAETWWKELQSSLKKFSNQSEWFLVKGSGHDIHLEQPDQVVKIIKKLIQEYRQQGSKNGQKKASSY